MMEFMLVCLDVDFRSSLYCSSQTDLFIDIFIFFFCLLIIFLTVKL